MINYVVEYEPGVTPPNLCKEITMSDGSKVCTHLLKENEVELEHFTNEQILQHANNLLAYVHELSAGLEPRPDEEVGFHPWPIINFNETQLALQSALLWWQMAYFRNNESHDGHSHDPVTGEEIPN